MQVARTGPSLDRLLHHLGEIAARSELLFMVLVSFAALALASTLEYCLTQVGFAQVDRAELLRHGPVFLLFMTILLGPLVETLLLQQIPVLLARRFHLPVTLQFAAGSVPFAILHFDAGAGGVAAGIAGGLTYSLAYLTFLQKSRSKAYWLTAGSHAIYNVMPSVMLLRDFT